MAGKAKKTGINAGDNSVVIGGSVTGSNIVIGNNNTVSNSAIKISPLFDEIYKKLEAKEDIKPHEKEDIQAELKDVQNELEKPEPDETFLTRRFRNIKRMAPDIMEVAVETLKNPLGGVAEVMKKVVKRMADEAEAKE
jgi:hypothetical protein